jgi:hypothetical protein
MAHVYFHCSGAQGAHHPLRCEVEIEHPADVQDYAAQVVNALIGMPCTEDWREWVLHALDHRGEELFVLPFTKMLGRLQ